MSGAAEIWLAGERIALGCGGAAFLPARRALLVADLHFEKGSGVALRGGPLLPPYDTRATLTRLAAEIARFDPDLVVSLGDAFHDRAAEARMDAGDAAALGALIRGRRWVWILGNHDPAPPARLGGAAETALALGPLTLRHEPSEGAGPGTGAEIAGHLHPCARVRGDLRTLRRRCYAVGPGRMVLPAFGAYAGGLNVLDPAFAPLFDGPPTAYVMGRTGVWPIPPERLAPDGAAARAGIDRRAGAA